MHSARAQGRPSLGQIPMAFLSAPRSALRGGFAHQLCYTLAAMSWRSLCWVLFILMLLVGLLRLMTGNLLGAFLPLVGAVYFGSIALDYPLVNRIKRIARLVWRFIWPGRSR